MKLKTLIFGLILIFSCNETTKKDNEKPVSEIVIINQKTTKQDQFKPSYFAVIKFLEWYKINYEDISRIEMIENWGGEYDSTKFYSINFEETERYLKKLKSSNFISDKYLEKWRKYFYKCEDRFQKNHQNEGPPNGFEFDFVLWTQEVSGTLEAIDYPELIMLNESKDKSIVKIDILMRLSFNLSKENNQWLIDDIENLGLDE